MTDTLQDDAATGGEMTGPDQPGTGRTDFDRFSENYGIVLLLIIATIVLAGLFAGSAWGRPIIVFVMGVTLQVGLAASRASSRQHRFASALSTVLVVVAVAGLATGNRDASALAIAVMSGVLVILLPVAIIRGVVEQSEINVRTIAGALCVYLLAGLFFAFLFMTMDALTAGSFFAQDVPYHPFDFIYFSFVTMTTVGYGDLTAAGDTGRMLAVLEALLGQIYLVTIVALLVGNMGRQREQRRRQERARRIKALRRRGRGAKEAEVAVLQNEIEDADSDAEELRAAADELNARADELDAKAARMEGDIGTDEPAGPGPGASAGSPGKPA